MPKLPTVIAILAALLPVVIAALGFCSSALMIKTTGQEPELGQA